MRAPAFFICISFSFHFPRRRRCRNGWPTVFQQPPETEWLCPSSSAKGMSQRQVGAGFRTRLLGAARGCTVALFPLGWRFAFSLLERVVRLLHGTDGSVFRRGSAREDFEEGRAHSWTLSPKALRCGPVRFFTGGVGSSSFRARYFFFAGAPGTGAVTASASRLPGVVR